ncbi:MAG: polyprenyl synthetase family protein [Thermomicrobiales bacterium]
MNLQQKIDVFSIMRADLARVDERVSAAAELDYPIASTIIGEIVRAGGKRLRPLILLLAGRAYDQNLDTLVTAAAGVELLHTASLIHDDTVDRAALRRGKPTLNSVMSSGGVILVGDYLFAQSAMLAAATNSPRIVSVFASTLGDICDGQLREMFDAHRIDQTREQYERRIYGKTASLFAGSAEMGAIIGQAPEDHISSLRQYGSHFGMAFQIVDDVLDLTEGTQDLGKPAGHDLLQGTVTLPTMIYAGRLDASSPDLRRLEEVVEGENLNPDLIDEVVASIRRSGAIEESVAIARVYVERAKMAARVVPDLETSEMLSDIAEFALRRLK